jgi:hypothetical protein
MKAAAVKMRFAKQKKQREGELVALCFKAHPRLLLGL